ncbi:uncharacterized protein LOC143636131 [Bidens hawaiensis]|uniref:uncharacterized protein LOC143636131 n=1 Tax=Bidens hawaiensis TaxID=980011 RepID=UPI0040499B43
MVISWILNTLSRDISESALYVDTANALWNELNQRFGQASGEKMYQLKKSLCEISQGSKDIATYFTKMKSVWDELSALDSLHVCSCGSSHLFAKREQDDRLVQFLMGLNLSYDNIRGNILMMKPLPSMSEVYSILVQDEKQREMHSSTPFVPESASMNVANQNSYGKFDNKKGLFCTHCKKSGHLVNKCYRLVGFPFKFTKTKRFSTNVDVTDQDYQESASPLTNTILGFTSEKISDLLQLLQRNNVEKSAKEPSPTLSHATFAGESDHMCFDDALLTNVKILSHPVYLRLPNGQVITVHKYGTLVLNPNLSLCHVLHVPQFKHNLLSIPKICQDTKGLVFFSDSTFVLQAP